MDCRFSANLGFLWREQSMPDAIRSAARAGFDAVECHSLRGADLPAIAAALRETHLPMVSLNTWPGDPAAGEFGLAALPGREPEARAAIDEAIGIARQLGAAHVHVMAGCATETAAAREAFAANLRHAAARAADAGVGVLIEPINRRDVPGYFLSRVEQAAQIIAEVAHPALRLMFDCYHVQTTEGDLARRLAGSLALVGHVQIAAVPSRAEPDEGEVDYPHLLRHLSAIGYRGFVGAEYRPRMTTDAGIGWLKRWRASSG